MTAEQFGELAADLWRAKQRFNEARQRIDKDGLIIRRAGKLRANPACHEYALAGREVKRLLRALTAA